MRQSVFESFNGTRMQKEKEDHRLRQIGVLSSENEFARRIQQ